MKKSDRRKKEFINTELNLDTDKLVKRKKKTRYQVGA